MNADRRRYLWRLLGLSVLVFLGSIGILYFVLDWHGDRSWDHVGAELRSRGEVLHWEGFMIEGVRDADNFSRHPLFAQISVSPGDQWRLSLIPGYRGGGQRGEPRVIGFARSVDVGFSGTPEDAARVVLTNAEAFDDEWSGIRSAAERPETSWPEEIATNPELRIQFGSLMLRLAQSLNAQAIANLHLGESDAALSEVELIVNLASRCTTAPDLLINHLVRMSMVALAVEVIVAGLDLSAWEDSQLEKVIKLVTAVDHPRELQDALRGERLFFIDQVEAVMADGTYGAMAPPAPAADQSTGVVLNLLSLRPRGLGRLDAAKYVGWTQRLIDAVERPTTLPEEIAMLEEEIAKQRSNPINLALTPFSLLSAGATTPAVKRTFYLQNQILQLAIACAIERFRLATGSLPETLDSLVPKYIPNKIVDPLTGQPMRYREDPSSGYLLYALGWDQTDDGGESPATNPHRFQDAKDWVWRPEPPP